MFDSVRVRLALWYMGILALLLVTFSAGVYAILWRNFMERADGVLRSVSAAVVSILEKDLSENGLDELAARDTVEALNFPEYSIGILDASGELLAERPFGSHRQLDLRTLPNLAPGQTSIETHPSLARGDPRRVAVTHVKLAPMERQYTILVSRSLTPLLGELAADRRILLIAVPLGALLAGAAGWFLARKSLAPVLAMSQQAHRIGVENLEERLHVANPRDELGRLAATFNELLSRLSGAFQIQRRFMADASHELRTPISVVRTTASVVLSKNHREESEYRGALTIVEAQARRLTRLVEDMLRLARADAGHVVLQERPFYLDEMLLESIQAAIVLANQKEIEIAIDDLPEGPFRGDEDLLRQMVMNLLDNAVKYTPPRGRIRVSLASQNGDYTIRVADTGRGIPADAQAHIFDRFYRVEEGRSEAAGAGLGLAIARWIAEIHHGSLELESSTPEGSVFCALLPRAY
ncbi:MAG TPA: ATP-binding protein [Bryobacteraceae bacterium]|nr:ATP-binding protein [Bryobacteraceae bacterium]